MLDKMLELLQIHGPIGAVVLGIIYVGNKHINRDREAELALQARLAALEADRVVKHDLEVVNGKIDAISTQIQDNQNVLLQVLTTKN